jgi:purine catabolism regulator
MPVPLSWVLTQEDLALRPVSGPWEDVSVDWAHAIELEDPSPFLAGGELVLTTGLRMPRTIQEQTAYVDRLAAVGVAALGFGVGVRFTAIPRGVVTRCAEVGLPLLEVPLPTPFIAIAQRIAHRLSEQQQEQLQSLVSFQQSLTRRTLREGSAGLVAGLAGELHAPVVLLDERAHLVVGSGRSQALARDVAAEVERHRPARARGAVHRFAREGTGVAELYAVSGLSAHRGWLVVGVTPDLDQRLLVQHALALATLQLDRPRELEEARLSVGAMVLGLLLEQVPAAPELVGQLRHLGIAPGEPVRLLALATGRPASLEPVLQSHLAAVGVPHALVHAEPGLVALVPDRDTRAVLGMVRASLTEVGGPNEPVGVSAACEPSLVGRALVQAVRAAHAARLERTRESWFDTVTLEAVLDDDEVRGRIRALAQPSLAALLRDDDPERELLRTLEAFLDHNGSWETASRALGVHRHTLRKRMARIEELTGLRLEVARNRVVLALAIATLDPADSG